MNIAADIPPGLADADEALTAYGRWAADRDSRRRCGSAEGHYRPESWHALEDRRTPMGMGMTLQEALVCQRALARVADRERMVLSVLYIPRRLPPEAQLRLLRIPPQLSQQRHLAGLQIFDNWRRVLTSGADPYNPHT
jgi:hypothetical protein